MKPERDKHHYIRKVALASGTQSDLRNHGTGKPMKHKNDQNETIDLPRWRRPGVSKLSRPWTKVTPCGDRVERTPSSIATAE